MARSFFIGGTQTTPIGTSIPLPLNAAVKCFWQAPGLQGLQMCSAYRIPLAGNVLSSLLKAGKELSYMRIPSHAHHDTYATAQISW